LNKNLRKIHFVSRNSAINDVINCSNINNLS